MLAMELTERFTARPATERNMDLKATGSLAVQGSCRQISCRKSRVHNKYILLLSRSFQKVI